jgi:hypothetical protein
MVASIIIVLALVIVVFLVALILSSKSGKKDSVWKLKAKENLNRLYPSLKSNDQHILKSLLIDLDKLLDFCMREYGIRGENMGERLKNAGKLYNKDLYNKMWRAHKTRNQLVHEVGYSITSGELKSMGYDLIEAVKRLIK